MEVTRQLPNLGKETLNVFQQNCRLDKQHKNVKVKNVKPYTVDQVKCKLV